MINHHRHVLSGEETPSRDSSPPEEPPDQPSPATSEPSLPGLAGGQLEVFAEVADLRAPFVPAPNLMLIQAVALSGGPEAEETIRRHHENLADEANGELQCSMEAIVALALGTLRAIELDAVRLRKELAKVNQFYDTEPATVRWHWWDRFIFGLLAILVVVLLGAEWCNASTLLKSSGVEDFVRSDLRAFGATIAAVLLALLLKTAASAIPRRSVRYALAFIPALVSLSAWVVLMSIAFPGYALSPMALLNLGGESMGPPVGLPAGHAWLLPASACFGIAWGAAAVTVYIDDFYHDRTAAKREINPQYARTEAALQGVLKALAVQAEQLGRGQGMLKRVSAARQITVDQAVALYLSLRTAPPPPRSTGLGFHRPRLSKPSHL